MDDAIKIVAMTEEEIREFELEFELKIGNAELEEALRYMASIECDPKKSDHIQLWGLDQGQSRKNFPWNADGLNNTEYNNMLACLLSWHCMPLNGSSLAEFRFENISPSKISDCALKQMILLYCEGGRHETAATAAIRILISARGSDVRRLLREEGEEGEEGEEERESALANIISVLNDSDEAIPTWLLGDFLGVVKEIENLDRDISYALNFLNRLHLPITLTRIKLFFSGYFSEAFSPYLSSAAAEAAVDAWGDNGGRPPEEEKRSIWSRIKNFFANLFNRKGDQYSLQGEQKPSGSYRFSRSEAHSNSTTRCMSATQTYAETYDNQGQEV